MKVVFSAIVKSFIIVTIVIISFSSCKKDDPDPDYVGTWIVLGNYYTGETTVEMKDVMTLNKGSFSEKIQIKNPTTNTWVDYYGFKGALSVNAKILNVTINEAGLSAINPVTSVPTGVITYYKSTDAEFTQIVQALEIPTTLESEYSVATNELTLKTDSNKDGDYTDAGEVVTFTRQ